MQNNVDIVIPSKDRALQLHLLLESMNKYVKNMGEIIITWQGSNEKFKQGYELLKARVLNDDNFANLRKNSKNIIFIERNSLQDVYQVYQKLSKKGYILPLVDDDIFFRECDLKNDNIIQYFFNNASSIYAYALRLGDDLSEQVSSTYDIGTDKKGIKGHFDSLDSYGKPRYIYPMYSHVLNDNQHNNKYVLWNVIFNQNIPHWGLFSSVSGYIYDKKDWFLLLEIFGRQNFLKIEAKANKYYIKKYLNFFQYSIYRFLNLCDKGIYKLFLKSFVYQTEVMSNIYLKYVVLKNNYLNKKSEIKEILIAPKNTIIYNINLGFSMHRKEVGRGDIDSLNENYLKGSIIDIKQFKKYKIELQWNIFRNVKYINYVKEGKLK